MRHRQNTKGDILYGSPVSCLSNNFGSPCIILQEEISFTLYFQDIVTKRTYFLKSNDIFAKPAKFYIFLYIYSFVQMAA